MNDRFNFRVWWNSPFVNEESKYLYYNPNEFCHTTDIVRDASCDSVEDIVYYDIRDIILGDIDEFEKPNTFIVEQCTGLKDKNGNLIYENDRVGFYVYGQDEEWHAQQGTVIWYNSCWGIETSSRFIQFENELTIKNPKDIEIIGNVHTRSEE